MSPAQRRAKAAAIQRQLDAHDDAQCRSYGAYPGSQPYFQCRMTLAQMRNQSEEAQKARIAQFLMATQAYAAQQRAAQAQMLNSPAPSTNCTTSYIGTQAYTHCN